MKSTLANTVVHLNTIPSEVIIWWNCFFFFFNIPKYWEIVSDCMSIITDFYALHSDRMCLKLQKIRCECLEEILLLVWSNMNFVVVGYFWFNAFNQCHQRVNIHMYNMYIS